MIMNILYTQNESANQKNTIIVDGIIYSDMLTGVASDAFKSINKISNEAGNWIWLIDKLKDFGKIESKNFKFIKDSTGIFIKACFQEKDELDRNMPFMFYTQTTSLNEACNLLEDYAKKIHRTCFEKELKILPYLSDKVIYGIVSLCIILLIIILWIIAD